MAALVKDAQREPTVTTLAFQLYEDCQCLRCLKCVVELIDVWTRDHYVYVSDGPEMEIVNTPAYDVAQILEIGSFGGDCDDVAVFLAAIYKALGLYVRFVAVRNRPGEGYAHVYVEVYTNQDGWIAVDPTVPEGTEYNDYGRMVLNA